MAEKATTEKTEDKNENKPKSLSFRDRELRGFDSKQCIAELEQLKKDNKSVFNNPVDVDEKNNLALAQAEFKARSIIQNNTIKGKLALLAIMAIYSDNDSTGAELGDSKDVNCLGLYDTQGITKPISPKLVLAEINLTINVLKKNKKALKQIKKRYHNLNS